MAGSGSAAGRRGRLLTKIEISCTAVQLCRYGCENTFKIVRANHVIDELDDEFAGMNMAEIMQDQLMNDKTMAMLLVRLRK